MLRLRKATVATVMLALAFLGGYLSHRDGASGSSDKTSFRKPLYYRDPMHPAYKSDKPGIAPDCGMELEPVYAFAGTAQESASPLAAGAMRVDSRKQQLIGLRTTRVVQAPGVRTIHVFGKVAADETRIDRVTALADGVVRAVSPYTAGSIVHRDDLLATYFVATRDIYTAIQGLILASGTYDQQASAVTDSALIKTSKSQSRVNEELLKSYGLTGTQIKELARTREATRDIDFRAPVSGIVLNRNVSRGQTVARGAELFTIADLTHIWVLADVFENDEGVFKPGATAQVTYGGSSYAAVISSSRLFDPVTRTFKVRLDLNNPGMKLRPDMFVNVDFDVKEPRGLSVPTDSILDAGFSKRLFVNTKDDVFESRVVTIGDEYGGRVQVLSGLMEGENVVTSGMFLLDSESRLEAVSASADQPKSKAKPQPGKYSDPVCGMPLNAEKIAAASTYRGIKYRFCSKKCKAKFDNDPGQFADQKMTANPETKPL